MKTPPPRIICVSFVFLNILFLSFSLIGAKTTDPTLIAPLVKIETVVVDDAGNKADKNGLGAVNHNFKIGKYDVTVSQWCAFLNAVATKGFPVDPYHLFDPSMQKDSFVSSIKKIVSADQKTISYRVISKKNGDPEAIDDPDTLDRGELPITYIDLFSTVRFVNWLSLGQPVVGEENEKTTEDGPYTIQGEMIIPRFTPDQESYDHEKWPGGFWHLPSEDEWYKAAYYQKAIPGVSDSLYWIYSTSEANAPGNQVDEASNQPPEFEGSFQNANYALSGTFATQQAPYLTPVGFFKYSPGPFGTYDMGGNVAQWTDSIVPVRRTDKSTSTVDITTIRGGSWKSMDPREISSQNYVSMDQKESGSQGTQTLHFRSNDVGFRVVLIEDKEFSYSGMLNDYKETIAKDASEVYNSKDGFNAYAKHPDISFKTMDYGIGTGEGATLHGALIAAKYAIETFLKFFLDAIQKMMQWIWSFLPKCITDALNNLMSSIKTGFNHLTGHAGASEVAAVSETTEASEVAAISETTSLSATAGTSTVIESTSLLSRLGGVVTQLYEFSPTIATACITGALGIATYQYHTDPELSTRKSIGLNGYSAGLFTYLIGRLCGAAPFVQATLGL